MCISLSVMQSSFASTKHSAALLSRHMCRSLRSGPYPSDYVHMLSAYYFRPATFLNALSLLSSLSARQVSHHTSRSFQTFSVFCLSTERTDESYIKAPTAISNCRLTTSEDAWVFLRDKADMPLTYRVKVHKCASLVAVL